MQVSIHEAKTHLSRLLKAALAGERVIIARGRTPLVELKPLEHAGPRRVGEGAGTVLYVADDFDDPLDDFADYEGR